MDEQDLERVRLLAGVRDAIDAYLDFELGEREGEEESDQAVGAKRARLTPEILRDWAIMHERRSFKTQSVMDHFDVSLPTALRRLDELLEVGVIERRGKGRNTRYLYTPKTDPGAAALADIARARERKPPEIEALNGNGHGVSRGTPVALDGPAATSNKDIRDLLDACKRAGWISESGTKHIKVKVPSGRTVTIPKTPSDHRALANCRSLLRREGLKV